MKEGKLPVALVEAWIFIETYDQFNLSQEKCRAKQAIKEHFGSLEQAQKYIKDSQSTEQIF